MPKQTWFAQQSLGQPEWDVGQYGHEEVVTGTMECATLVRLQLTYPKHESNKALWYGSMTAWLAREARRVQM